MKGVAATRGVTAICGPLARASELSRTTAACSSSRLRHRQFGQRLLRCPRLKSIGARSKLGATDAADGGAKLFADATDPLLRRKRLRRLWRTSSCNRHNGRRKRCSLRCPRTARTASDGFAVSSSEASPSARWGRRCLDGGVSPVVVGGDGFAVSCHCRPHGLL